VQNANTLLRSVASVWLFALAVIGHPALSQGAESSGVPLPEALLRSCLETQRKTDWIIFHGHSESSTVHREPTFRLGETILFKRHGDLLDITVTRIIGPGYTAVPAISARPSRFLVTPTLYLKEGLSLPNEAARNKTHVAEKKRDEQRTAVLNNPLYLGILDGYFQCAGGKRAAELLLEAKELKLLADETIGEHRCKVVEGKTPCGLYKLWLDADGGCLPRKASLVKREDDLLATGERLRDFGGPHRQNPLLEAQWTLSDLVLSRIANTWITIEAKCSTLTKRKNNTTYEEVLTLSRSDVEFQPDFNKSDSFVPSVGAEEIVANVDDPDSGTRYRLREGRIEPAGKHHVPPNETGSWLQGQAGFRLLLGLDALVVLLLAIWLFARRKSRQK
jgi:hypothetical protein